MATPLTGVQIIAIGTNNFRGPWRASALLKNFGTNGGYPLSLLSAGNRIQAHQSLWVLTIRDVSIVSASSSFSTLQTNWAATNPAWVPTRQHLESFFKFLNANGVAVKGLSNDWRSVVLTGSIGAFAAIPGLPISSASDVSVQPPSGDPEVISHLAGWDAVTAGATLGIGIMVAAGALTGPPGWLFAAGVISTAVVSGLLTGYGMYDLVGGPLSDIDPLNVLNPDLVPNPGFQAPDGTMCYGVSSDSDAQNFEYNYGGDNPALDFTTAWAGEGPEPPSAENSTLPIVQDPDVSVGDGNNAPFGPPSPTEPPPGPTYEPPGGTSGPGPTVSPTVSPTYAPPPTYAPLPTSAP